MVDLEGAISDSLFNHSFNSGFPSKKAFGWHDRGGDILILHTLKIILLFFFSPAGLFRWLKLIIKKKNSELSL